MKDLKNAKNLEKVKCPKCGVTNLAGTKKCFKCKYDLDFENKVCPRCGKVVTNETNKCPTCRYKFSRKKVSIWINLIISIIVVLLLIILVNIDKNLFNKFSFGFKVLTGFMVFVIAIRSFTYGKDERIKYSAEDTIMERHDELSFLRKFSNIAIIVGGIIVFCVLVYYYLFRK